ncbi:MULTISPECIES: YopX family protein [Bacillus]|uniref:YopX family protein n=1 Tax=Bacillus TaxID=1386 RepID=UPI0006AE9F6B|nr:MULTISPECIES: YopX family protein [Bacillus]AWD88515.1 hypothetical protein BVQ_13995 [Bacillus velezensis]KAF6693225.1 hypothetical protein G9362_12085 [Bacillus sp. EKM601B]KOS49295.1 hypothetical protein AN272_19420 [Bacillus amyloliquefaciens]MBA9148946.1 hypothetical protein [Bacillus sp. EKM213B]MDZ7433648.1 YopX family protein [Bacillus amyloliquefaciens]
MDIIIRYVFKHRATGNIEIKIYSIGQLEERVSKKLSPCFDSDEYELVERNLYTGREDVKDNRIYQGDITRDVIKNQIGIICYDRHQANFKVVPISMYFANAGNGGWTGYHLRSTVPLEVVGNIYQSPELWEDVE